VRRNLLEIGKADGDIWEIELLQEEGESLEFCSSLPSLSGAPILPVLFCGSVAKGLAGLYT
jgi:hypothetical protein